MKYSARKDEFTGLRYYECSKCSTDIHPWQCVIKENEAFCVACAFKSGYIDEVEYCNTEGKMAWFMAAGINPVTREIETVSGSTVVKWVGRGINKRRIELRKKRGKFTWEMSDKEARHCGIYMRMKKRVIERDEFKCVKCGTDENLHTHHIKSFKHHKELRFVDSNVITVCVECHKQEHKRR